MDEPADLSSQDRPGWHLLDECVSTRNRKVVGSNPTSGSNSAKSVALLACFAWSFPSSLAALVWSHHNPLGAPPGCCVGAVAAAPDWVEESLLPGGGRRDGRALGVR